MSAEWSVERLDALPDRTIIECTQVGLSPLLLMLHSDLWLGFSGVVRMPSDLIIERYQRRQGRKLKIGSIRVVSVPVDALLSDEALVAADSAGINAMYAGQDDMGSCGVRAAIAHITGEEATT